MDEEHRELITKNISTLVNLTTEKHLEELLDHVYQNKIMSIEMVERNKSIQGDLHKRVRNFYLDLQRRGPEAFDKFLNILFEIGHWHIYGIFEPNRKKPAEHFYSLKKSPVDVLLPVEPIIKPKPDIIDDEKIEPIVVTKAKSFNDNSNSDIPCYIMNSKNRGVLLMINNIEFDNDIEAKREGAKVDEDKLKTLFEQIGFHKCVVENNLTKEEFIGTLKEFSKSPILKHTDCIFVIIASHGVSKKSETSVICKDGGNISTTEILEYFNSENCTALHNIPKIFIFQLCRGTSPDFGYSPSMKEDKNLRKIKKSDRTQFDGKVTNVTMRTYCDMLIIHSTVPGFQSHRDKIQGSWYFISMCKIFMNHCHNTHLDDLFKLVDDDLKDIFLKNNTVQTSSIQHWGFNKHCYLNPGLFNNNSE